jgi:hypothetical protein
MEAFDLDHRQETGTNEMTTSTRTWTLRRIVSPSHPSFAPILCLKVLFSLVQPSSHLTLRRYAKRGSENPNILIGTHEMPMALASQNGLFG